MMDFPAGFLWGVATSAHQVEGGTLHNQWAEWEAQGRIRDGSVSGDACAWWKRAPQDLAVAQQLGLNAVRISIEWSRLEPQEGRWDSDAMARYYTLLVDMQQRGLRPFVTLHHFTHPKWFEARGGFLAPDAVETFSRFVYRVVEALRYVCHDWVTINEPNVYCALGYLSGEFPPGVKGDLRASLRTMCRLAQCHAAAYRIIHSFQPDANVGWAQNYVTFRASSRTRTDRFAARLLHTLFNESFFDLLATGHLRSPWHRFGVSATEAQGQFDFTGLNVYSRLYVAVDPRATGTLFSRIHVPDHVPQGDSAAEWAYGECYPDAVVDAVRYASQYRRPIYITENGVPDRDDRIRPWLLVHVLRRLHQLIATGCDIRGYFHWTLVDAFEWTEGWRLRFGLYELDPVTQARRARPSARLYSTVAKANGLSAELYKQYSDLSVAELAREATRARIHGLFTALSS
jgi:beta-glucosidase